MTGLLACWEFVQTWWKDVLKWCAIVVGVPLFFLVGIVVFIIIGSIFFYLLGGAVEHVLSFLFGKGKKD